MTTTNNAHKSQKAEQNLLRKHFLATRREITETEALAKSQIIQQKAIEYFLQNKIEALKMGARQELPNKKIVSLYFAINNEVLTNNIADFCLSSAICCCYPKMLQKDSPLVFVEQDKSATLARSVIYPTITEPLITAKSILLEPNIIFTPLVAFDKHCNRLGMGGGFYDRTIADFKKRGIDFISIGLAFENQRVTENIETTEFDQKLDFIITETDIYRKS
jgi:5-formyltetrahydrofolate cyclo-ligase